MKKHKHLKGKEKQNMKKEEIETLIIKNSGRNFIYITIKIKDKGDYYLFKAEKLDLSFESTNHNFEESKKEFALELMDLFDSLIARKELLSMLEHYGFNLRLEKDIIIEKKEEMSKFYNKKQQDTKVKKQIEATDSFLLNNITYNWHSS